MRLQKTLPRFFLCVFLLLVFIHASDPAILFSQQTHALWDFTADGPFSGSANQTITALKDNGINAVFVDRLDGELMKAVRAAGIRVFTTVQVFGDHSLWKTHPQLRPVNDEGDPLPAKYGSGICPTQRWYWPAILQNISRKLAAGYDGVWLDFVRFGSLWEDRSPRLEELCFCDSTLADFSRATGIVIPDSVLWPDSLSAPDSLSTSDSLAAADSSLSNGEENPEQTQKNLTARKAAWILANHQSEWTQYKTTVITDFVKRAKALFANKPNKRLGLYTVPWRRNENRDAILRIFGQDYRALAEYVDVFSPMLYHELTGRPITWIGGFVKYTSGLTKKPVWPIIQCELGEKHRVSDEEFALAVLTALDPPSKGVIVFRQAPLIEAKQLPVLRASWK